MLNHAVLLVYIKHVYIAELFPFGDDEAQRSFEKGGSFDGG